MMLSAPANAHDLDELEGLNFNFGTRFALVNLSDTVADRQIVCAVYGSESNFLASGRAKTDNLATEVTILVGDDAKNVASTRCAFND